MRDVVWLLRVVQFITGYTILLMGLIVSWEILKSVGWDVPARWVTLAFILSTGILIFIER